MEFPQRKDFDVGVLLRDHASTRLTKHAAISQSWCFFGLAIEIFAAVKVEVTVEDFVQPLENGGMRLTTHRLPSLSRQTEMMTRNMPLNERGELFCIMKPYPVSAGNMVRRVPREIDDLTWHAVHLSALMLGEYLTSMMRSFLQVDDDTPNPWFGRSTFAPQLMDEAGWCPSLSRSLVDQEVEQSFIYYLSRMRQRDTAQTHLCCSYTYCMLDKLDHETYQTKHADDCRGLQQCSTMILDHPEWNSLVNTVEKHLTPVLTVVEGAPPHEIKVIVTPSDQDTASSAPDNHDGSPHGAQPYVCISHVWSDGLGNLRQNTLPVCQLRRLQRKANNLYDKSSHPVPFWIDTICVPLEYPNRGIAINSMRKTYKDADKVLVLDSAIAEVSSQTHDATEMVVRLKASSWVRRLWTFHEAYLARELHYQFNDGALRLSAILEKYHREFENLPPGVSGHQTERIKKRIERADPVWWNAYRFLEQVEVLGKDAPQEDHARLRSIIHPLRWRTTSRIQDETICLSGCINRTVEDLPYIPDADPLDLAIERMKTFLSSLQTVPLGLLFVQRSHIQHDGCRWMPTSFLGGGMDSTLPDPWQKEDVATGRPAPSGLVVTLPGIMLSDVTEYTQDFRGGHTHDIIFIRVNGRAYYVYGLLTEAVQWRIPDAGQLAIVLREELDERGTFACLVSMIANEAGVKHCRFESCVMAMGNPQIHRNLNEIIWTGAKLMGKGQVWCVG